jgi:hypothetical protein
VSKHSKRRAFGGAESPVATTDPGLVDFGSMTTLKHTIALTRAGGAVLDELVSGAPEELFHYTDTNGLIGILTQKGEIWATDAQCMNDTNELTLGRALLDAAIADKKGEAGYDLLARLLAHPAYVSGVVFTTSFSANRDLLSQWRAYANNGDGFALGFRAAELTNLKLDGKDVIQYLVRVDYRADTQRARVERLVDCVLQQLAPLSTISLSDQDEQFLAAGLGLILPTFCAACKNVGFEEEAEHRLVLRSMQDSLLAPGAKPGASMPVCAFRSGRYGITPFVRLRFPDGGLTKALSRIVVGPRVSTPEEKLRLILANGGLDAWSTFPIEHATATYR